MNPLEVIGRALKKAVSYGDDKLYEANYGPGYKQKAEFLRQVNDINLADKVQSLELNRENAESMRDYRRSQKDSALSRAEEARIKREEQIGQLVGTGAGSAEDFGISDPVALKRIAGFAAVAKRKREEDDLTKSRAGKRELDAAQAAHYGVEPGWYDESYLSDLSAGKRQQITIENRQPPIDRAPLFAVDQLDEQGKPVLDEYGNPVQEYVTKAEAHGRPKHRAPGAGQQKDKGSLETLLDNTKILGELIKTPGLADQFGGPFGIKGAWTAFKRKMGGGSAEAGNLISITENMADNLLRARSGAQINESEYARLRPLIPTIDDPWPAFLQKFKYFTEESQRILANRYGKSNDPAAPGAPGAGGSGAAPVISYKRGPDGKLVRQ